MDVESFEIILRHADAYRSADVGKSAIESMHFHRCFSRDGLRLMRAG